MTSSDVQVAADGPGKRIETVALTSDEAGTPTTQRQVVALGDATTFANKAHVDASGNIAVSVSNLPGTQPVSGSVAVSSLPGSPAQDGTDATGVTAPTGGVGIRGWLSGIYQRLGGTLATSRTWTLGSGTDSVDIGNFPGTQPVSGSVAVSSLPGSIAQDGTDSSDANATQATAGVGIRGWLSTLVSLFRSGAAKVTINGTPAVSVSGSVATTLSGTPAVSVSNLPATQPVSGTVAVSGAVATSVADGADTALGSTSDASSGNTAIALFKNIKAALAGTLTISGAVTNSNLDVALSTRLKPADTLAGVTTVAAVTAITNPLPSGTNTIGAVKQATQASLTATLCSTLTGTGAQTGQSLDGYDGAGTLQITAVGTVGAQAVSLQIEGSIDNSNWGIIGTAQIDATANPSYAAANFTITPGASTISHLYAVRDTVKFIRVNVTANNLGTGLTVSYYSNPV